MTDERGHRTLYRDLAPSERLRHFAINAMLDNYTLYPSEYLTITTQGYTKYYYANGNRIASKIGTGGFEKMQQLCTLDQSLTADANTLFDNILQHAVNTTNPPTDEYPVEVCNGYNVATELLTEPLLDFYISQTNLNFTQNNLLQQFRQNLAGGTEAVYYFHSDHLGSASWITNNTGLPVQHLLYLPFGEHFANEHSSGYDERFTFTGKERDAETGYYYHGARFNNSDIGWLSVDPMADKYPSLTPYNYCAWNPIKLVDPTGEEFTDFQDENGILIKHIDDGSNAVFRKTGNGTSLHYSFIGYNEQGGENQVNYTSAIQEQQQLNMENPSLQQTASGTTFCNFATQNIMKTIESTSDYLDVLVKGRANDMVASLINGDNPFYEECTYAEAKKYAENGGLAIVGYKNPTGGSGHVATFSVGDNVTKGEIANIGTTQYTGFVSLNEAINKKKEKHYFRYKIIKTERLKDVIVKSTKTPK